MFLADGPGGYLFRAKALYQYLWRGPLRFVALIYVILWRHRLDVRFPFAFFFFFSLRWLLFGVLESLESLRCSRAPKVPVAVEVRGWRGRERSGRVDRGRGLQGDISEDARFLVGGSEVVEEEGGTQVIE